MKKVFLNILRWVVLTLGILILADAVFLTFVSNRTLGVYLTYALGLIFLAIGIFYKEESKFGFVSVNNLRCMIDDELHDGDYLKAFSKVYGG
jgi:hypothetical protein